MEFTIDFQFINLFNIIIVWEKVIVMSQFSPKSRLKIWCTSDIQLTFSLCLLLRWSHNTILVESESNEKIGWKITLFDHKQKAFICWFVFYFPLPPPPPPQKKNSTHLESLHLFMQGSVGFLCRLFQSPVVHICPASYFYKTLEF